MIDNNSNSQATSNQKPLYYGKISNKYILIEKIGKGATSSVFSAFMINDDNSNSSPSSSPSNSPRQYDKIKLSECKKLYAIKICKKKWNPKHFVEEGRIMKNFTKKDLNIITFYETAKGTIYKFQKKKAHNVLYHVLELAENNKLFDYIKAANQGFGEKYGKILFYQILSAVQICHERGVIHKDIKTENILLSKDYQCKLADFGLSIQKNHKVSSTFAEYGTDGYFPPEVYSNKSFDLFQLDIFALGVCLFIIVCGFRPFIAAKRLDPDYKRIWRGNYDLYWTNLPNKISVSESFKELINKMFSLEPSDRLSIEEIKKSKWLSSLTEITVEDVNMLQKEFEMRKTLVEEFRKIKHSNEK